MTAALVVLVGGLVVVVIVMGLAIKNLREGIKASLTATWYSELAQLWSTDPVAAQQRKDNPPDYVLWYEEHREKML